MKIPLFLFCLGISFGVQAAPPSYFLSEHTSHFEEPLDDFMVRIAPVLQQYTHDTNHEACGRVYQNDDGTRFGVRLLTSKGAITCAIPLEQMEGMRPLRLTIHSHPQKTTVMPTLADVQFYQSEDNSGMGRTVLRGRPETLSNKIFSDPDFASGPGYLVSKGKVFYQEGKGTEREVGLVPE